MWPSMVKIEISFLLIFNSLWHTDAIWWLMWGYVSAFGQLMACCLMAPSKCLKQCWLTINGVRLLTLQWRHNGRDGISNHQPHHCLLNRLFWRRSKKTSKIRVTGLCAGNSLVTGEFPAQMASNVENSSIWWRQHAYLRPISQEMLKISFKKNEFEKYTFMPLKKTWKG